MIKQQTESRIAADLEMHDAATGVPSKIFEKHTRLAPLVLTILLFSLVACSDSTAPEPNDINGAVEGGAAYLLLDWPEGLRIMIWDDIVTHGGTYGSSTSATYDELFQQEGSAHAADGEGYEYTIETGDGLQANFAIDGVPYDLNRGNVFLIRVADEKNKVQQLDLDLSGVAPTNAGVEAFGQDTAEIADFIRESLIAVRSQVKGPWSTNRPEVNRLAIAVLSNDLEARRDLVRYTTAGCTNADGLGGPPKCSPDQAEGAPVEYLPVLGPGEGAPVLPEAVDGPLDFPAEALYAAYRRADEPTRDIYYPAGDYGLFFTTDETEPNIQFVLVHADAEGYIVRLDSLACPVDEDGQIIELDGLTCSPEQIIEREAVEILLSPP